MGKIKLLVISDDIRMPSGVGIQAYKLLTGLLKTGEYDIVEIAGSLFPYKRIEPIIYKGIKLYPVSNGYGDQNIVRQILNIEKPDILLAFSDPRFFYYLFLIDNEFRTNTKLILYHTWDNEPFPKFNLPWYSACDKIVMLSKFSYDLLSKNGVGCEFIPHGCDPSEFYPLPEDILKTEKDKICTLTGKEHIDFIIFWNNRNITRKRPGDVLYVFKEFYKDHPNSFLLLNTVPIDKDGTDLVHLYTDLNMNSSPIIFNFDRVTSDKLNLFYNVSDVTLNISYNEGFGLCVLESLCAGTPVIATRTGGMTEQIENSSENKQFGALLEPEVRELYGIPGAPYIFRDFVSYDKILNALDKAYKLKKEGNLKKLGLEGREYVIKNFNIDNTIKKFDELLHEVYNSPITFKKWKWSIH